MGETHFDVIVIGAGPIGENVAERAVKGGLTAAIVESYLVGGECSYFACIPSKALLRSSAALEAARRVDGAKQAITGPLDASGVLARRTWFTGNWHDDSQVAWVKNAGITLLRGHGRIADERVVEVRSGDGSVTRFTARYAVAICTGTHPAIPPIPGLTEASPWTNHDATRADRVPPRLAVLGGGPVACELAQAWRSLGAKEVTVLARGDRLLGRMEPIVCAEIAAAFRAIGITVRTGVNVTRVQRRAPATPVQIWFEHPSSGLETIEADEILVATGRTPNTSDIGLETIQQKPGDWLDVDDTCRVKSLAGGWLYAAGDVNHRALLTHMGKYQARACGDAIVARAKGELAEASEPAVPKWSRWSATADHCAVPQVVFTDPEAATVGLTEAQARAAQMRVRAVEYDISHTSGAKLVADGYRGFAKMIVDEDRGVMVGATLVGQDVGELIHAFTVAIVGEVPLHRLWHAVPCFPTISEIWLRLLESYGL
ncbi:MAG TPA: NAD(P)/FAD-dependent oxidoreductase [Bryobacteraceae bacterium]|jgi:dihydrolipoamide dehydrogenase|nr:NAD(P)/FAD-dependent oxidoreductase [Bryobacteraceae bacterium]